MAPASSGRGKGLGGLRQEGGEAFQLVVDYVKQETLDPVKGLGRFILFGVAGSVALSIGLAVLAVGLLRLLQGRPPAPSTATSRGSRTSSAPWWWWPWPCWRCGPSAGARPPAPTPRSRHDAPEEKITRDQIEAKFRELTGDVGDEVEGAKSQALTVGLAVAVVVVAVVFLIGRRNGRRRSTVVEVRRI